MITVAQQIRLTDWLIDLQLETTRSPQLYQLLILIENQTEKISSETKV